MLSTVQCLALLNDIEDGLKAANLWQALAPSEQALKSQAPFCVDTLSLEQWLQFVFLPRFRALIASKQPLPSKLSILPYAELAFVNYPQNCQALLAAIAALDASFNHE